MEKSKMEGCENKITNQPKNNYCQLQDSHSKEKGLETEKKVSTKDTQNHRIFERSGHVV